MITRRLFWLLPMLALQSGCALLNTKYSENRPQIDQWIGEQQYGQALKTLSRVEPQDPHYLEAADKRKQVEALAAAYEQEIRQQNSQRLEQGNWAGALDSYDEALTRLPDSVVLKDGLAQLHHMQTEELDRLELQRLKDHGNWLKQTIPTYRDIARVDPRNSDAQRKLQRIINEAESVADQLALHGNRAMANNDLQNAATLLELAAELSSAPAIQESLKKLNQRLSKEQEQARLERQKKLEQQRAAERRRQQAIETQLKKFEAAFKDGQYNSARDHLTALSRSGLDNKRYRTLQQRLSSAIDKAASEQFDAGINAYSRGQYDKAADHWRRVLELKPDNKQAREHLERAERVVEKLRELEQKQQ